MNASRTDNGYTALMWASQTGHLTAVQTLLNHGASKSATSFSGKTAYSIAQGPEKAALRALLNPG